MLGYATPTLLTNIKLSWKGLLGTNTGATTISIMTLSMMRLIIMGLFVTLSINNIQHKRHSA